MDVQANQVFSPASFQDLFSAWARFPDAAPFAGGTSFLRSQGKRVPVLPRNILSLDKLEELRRTTRTEHYLELGAMITLNEIIRLGKVVPEALSLCLEQAASPPVRNLATIGGNLCNPSTRLDAAAPMIALDAQYELRSAAQTRWISAARFSSLPGKPGLENQELLTRIRVPLDKWDYSLFRKFSPRCPGEERGLIVFLVKNQKNILTDLRIVFAGETVLRDKNTESLLIGKQLPLDRRDAANFTERWRSYLSALDSPGGFLKAGILGFIESSLACLLD
jgi:CO/xanthine dehydrogenase FAD-binding subunit